jgi:excisionase family DNA binding protein
MALITYHTIPAAAERLNVSPNTIQSWLWRGLLQRTKAGNRTLIAESEIERFLTASTAQSGKLRRERRAKKTASEAA